MQAKRKPNIKSQRRAARAIITDNVLRAVLCDARTETEIEELSGERRSEIDRALEYLVGVRLLVKTEAGYFPAGAVRRAG